MVLAGLGRITAQQVVMTMVWTSGDDASTAAMVASLSCRSCGSSAGLAPHIQLRGSVALLAGLIDMTVMARLSKLPGMLKSRTRSLARLSEVLEIRNTSRACLRSLITQERSPERNGVKLVNNEENVTSERVPLHGAPLPKQI